MMIPSFFALPGSASRRLGKTMDPQHEFEVVTLAYPIKFCNSSLVTNHKFIQLQICFYYRNVDTVMSKMHFWKISEICDTRYS